MTVGDIVSSIHNAIGVFTFQPAATVEIICLSFQGGTSNFHIGLTDGVNTVYTEFDANASVGGRTPFGKHGITNTNYLYLYTNVDPAGFSGIQIK
jgi:hypothetical protein